MRFEWPAESDSVVCFGCGASFPRPAHLPPVRRLPAWTPEALAPRGGARLPWIALALIVVCAVLLGLGVGLVF
jgi:hypothetical protein